MGTFTQEKLKDSIQFKEWITDKIALIHNAYWDDKSDYAAWIVIQWHEDSGGTYSITRFFENSNNKIMVSVDHNNLTAEEVFQILLSDYSTGLK